jgi:hypothetical protein
MLFGKIVITFAYELRLRQILYENSSTENFTHEIQPFVLFLLKLDFPKLAWKMEFWAFEV